MYEQQRGRQSVGGNYRRVIIDEVRPSSSYVSAHGQRGETYRISFDFHQPLVTVPLKDELWNIKMIGDGWYLDRKASSDDSLVNLEAGDSKIHASNNLFLSSDETIYIDGGGVMINGIPYTVTNDAINESLANMATAIAGASGGGNYVSNPSFNDSTTGYTSSDTLAIAAGVGIYGGSYAARVTKAGSTGTLSISSARVAIPPAQVYSASASARVGSSSVDSSRSATISINFYDAVGTLLSTVSSSSYPLSLQNVWARLAAFAALAPDATASAQLVVTITGVPVGEYYYFDGFQLEPGSNPTSFNANIPQSALVGSMFAPASVTVREAAIGSAKAYFGTASMISTVTGMADGSLYVTTDNPISIYAYLSGAWHLVQASNNVVNPIGLWDFPYTVDPRVIQATNLTFSANNIYYFRVQGQAEINGIGYHVGTADSANTITFGVYSNSGTGRSAVPNTLKASVTTGVQSGTGFKTATFGAPVVVNHGDWFALSTASTTVALARTEGTLTSNIALGLSMFQSGGGTTMPATVTASLFPDARCAVLVGA
jgi:hypothetical protein